MKTRAMLVALAACTVALPAIASAEESSEPSAYIGMEWNAFGLADHVSHGPGIQAGILLFDGYLKLGIYAFGRPGPANPATFDATPSDTYKGQDRLDLRSDGSFVGLNVAVVLPVAPWLDLELPVSVGMAGFGFYLSGEDRATPDGRRVSEWEDELFDGRDSSFTVGVQAGARFVWRPHGADWVRPYLGASWLLTPGYDTVVTDDYGGPSVSLGTTFAF